MAIYDAVNPTATGRRSLAKEFTKHEIEVRPFMCKEEIEVEVRAEACARHCSSSPFAMMPGSFRRM